MADTGSQRDPDVVSFSAFTGLRNDVTSERFGPTDLDFGDNIDIDKSGGVSRRDGRVSLTATATHSLWGDDVGGFCVQGTQLVQIGSGFTFTPIYSGLTAGQRMSYVRVDGCVYASNRRETLVVQGGVPRSWGLSLPPLPGVLVDVGNMPAGLYQYVMTYVRSDGQESGCGLAAQVTVPANSSLTFSFAQPTDSTVTAVNFYLTTPNGEILYLALTAPSNAGTATYGNTAQELDYLLKSQFLSAPPAGQLVTHYRGHTFVAVDDVIFPSEPFGYELFDLRNYIPCDGRVTMMAPLPDKERPESEGMNSGLFIATDRSSGALVGSDPASFQYVPKLNYGAVLGAVDYVDSSLFGDNSISGRMLPMWLSMQGICVGLPSMEIRNITRTKYGTPIAGNGAALFQPGPNRFISVSNF